MKKTYMKPMTTEHKVEIQSLLNIVSNGDGTYQDGDNGDLGDSDLVLSRGDSFWGDED